MFILISFCFSPSWLYFWLSLISNACLFSSKLFSILFFCFSLCPLLLLVLYDYIWRTAFLTQSSSSILLHLPLETRRLPTDSLLPLCVPAESWQKCGSFRDGCNWVQTSALLLNRPSHRQVTHFLTHPSTLQGCHIFRLVGPLSWL